MRFCNDPSTCNRDYGGHVLQSLLLLQILVVNYTQIICCLHIHNGEKIGLGFFVCVCVWLTLVGTAEQKAAQFFLFQRVVYTCEKKGAMAKQQKKCSNSDHTFISLVYYIEAMDAKTTT